MISNGKKAAIHIAMGQLGLSKEEYKEELMKCVGVSSSIDLNNKTFVKVMNHFKALGYISNVKDFREIDNLPEGDRKIMSKINAIRLDLDKSWAWVDGIAKQQTKIENVMWVKGENLHKVLKAMIFHQKRQQKKKA